MKSSAGAFVLITSFVLSACSHRATECVPAIAGEHAEKLQRLKALTLRNPIEDAPKAFAQGDTRLLGIYGYALEVPGYAGNPYAQLEDIRILEGTGDNFCTKEEEALNLRARAYAKKYNQLMLTMLEHAAPDSAIDANR